MKIDFLILNFIQEYIKNPVVTKQRMFYEAMEEVLPDLELIIDSTGTVDKMLPLDSFFSMESQTSQNTPSSAEDTAADSTP